MVDLINGASYQKVVTIEAPVEYLFANKKAMVTQMEVGLNASSFEHGLGLALKQDADVIVIGELCDPRVTMMALEAAESGRKVLAAMSGLYVVPTIGRLIAPIPPDERTVAVSQLANALEGVIAQQLAKTRDGRLRPAVEVLRGGVNRVQVDHGESPQGPDLLHGGSPGRDAVPRPAPARAAPVRGDQWDGDDATGQQPRGRGHRGFAPPARPLQAHPLQPRISSSPIRNSSLDDGFIAESSEWPAPCSFPAARLAADGRKGDVGRVPPGGGSRHGGGGPG